MKTPYLTFDKITSFLYGFFFCWHHYTISWSWKLWWYCSPQGALPKEKAWGKICALMDVELYTVPSWTWSFTRHGAFMDVELYTVPSWTWRSTQNGQKPWPAQKGFGGLDNPSHSHSVQSLHSNAPMVFQYLLPIPNTHCHSSYMQKKNSRQALSPTAGTCATPHATAIQCRAFIPMHP